MTIKRQTIINIIFQHHFRIFPQFTDLRPLVRKFSAWQLDMKHSGWSTTGPPRSPWRCGCPEVWPPSWPQEQTPSPRCHHPRLHGLRSGSRAPSGPCIRCLGPLFLREVQAPCDTEFSDQTCTALNFPIVSITSSKHIHKHESNSAQDKLGWSKNSKFAWTWAYLTEGHSLRAKRDCYFKGLEKKGAGQEEDMPLKPYVGVNTYVIHHPPFTENLGTPTSYSRGF